MRRGKKIPDLRIEPMPASGPTGSPRSTAPAYSHDVSAAFELCATHPPIR